MRAWNVPSEGPSAEPVLAFHTGADSRDIAYNPTGSSFATAGNDGVVRIWTPDGELLVAIPAHDGDIVSLAYSTDGTRLATLGLDGLAKILLLDIDDLIDAARSRVGRDFRDEECRAYLNLESCPTG